MKDEAKTMIAFNSSFILHPSSFRVGGILSVALSLSFADVAADFGRWALPTTASCGARTFLSPVLRRLAEARRRGFRAAAVRPTCEPFILRKAEASGGTKVPGVCYGRGKSFGGCAAGPWIALRSIRGSRWFAALILPATWNDTSLKRKRRTVLE